MTFTIDYNPLSFQVHSIVCSSPDVDCNIANSVKKIISDQQRITEWFPGFLETVNKVLNELDFRVELNKCSNYENDFLHATIKQIAPKSLLSVATVLSDEELNYQKIDDFIDFTLESKDEIVSSSVAINIAKIARLRNKKFRIPVIATMSAGKSTLINSLIGHDLLPALNEATTATLFEINVSEKTSEITGKVIHEEGTIENIVESSGLNSTFLSHFNTKANEEENNFKVVLDVPVGSLDINGLDLTFIDTPGPNNAQNTSHAAVTFTYLKDDKDSSLILFVLTGDYQGDDDKETLQEVGKVIKQNSGNLDRIIFVLNKVDQYQPQKQPLSETVSKVRRYLKKFEIDNAKIFPIAAEYAFLSQINHDNLDDDDKEKLRSYRRRFIPEGDKQKFDIVANSPLLHHQKETLIQNGKKSDLDNDLVHSGLGALVLYIEDYITNHYTPIKYKDLHGIAANVKDTILTDISKKKADLQETDDAQRKERSMNYRNEIESLEQTNKELINKLNETEFDTRYFSEFREHWETKFDELKIRALASGEIEFKKANELIKELNTKLEHLAGSVSTDISSLSHQKMTEYFEHLKNIIGEKYNDFGLSVEKDSLNAQMKNAINSFSIEDISKYKIINDKTVTQEVTSKKWYKRWFGIKDTIESTKKEVLFSVKDFYNNHIQPLSKEFADTITEAETSIASQAKSYQDNLISATEQNFEYTLKKVYINNIRDLNLSKTDMDRKRQQLTDLDIVIKTKYYETV